ncbi:MAG: UDP-N-acetylglucosamine 2-epimerase [Crocinitomicaceae bacterium]
MGGSRLKIAVLTSSRADYGIYLPLLYLMQTDPGIELSIIAFGSHLKEQFGNTIDQINNDGFHIEAAIDNLKLGDTPKDISLNYGHTAVLFADFWAKHKYDYVLCLGDRYEMAAAVNAGIPFGITFAHLHAGETSEGAIDNIFRDQITLASKLHFVSIDSFKRRIEDLTRIKGSAFYSGAIGLENIKAIDLMSVDEFKAKWGLDFSIKTMLVTVHPETINPELNQQNVEALKIALSILLKKMQILITMPNADTLGSLYREMFKELKSQHDQNLYLVENLGTQGYFSAMKLSSILFGNTSSGIIEAASFGKYVINIGNRQKGRAHGENVIHVPFKSEQLVAKTEAYFNQTYSGPNRYQNEGGIDLIIHTLKEKLNGL